MDQYKTTEAGRRLAKALLAAGDHGTARARPSGLPADRLRLLRDAYTKTMSDPQFQAEVKKRELRVRSGNRRRA